jgi:hypothetical protein
LLFQLKVELFRPVNVSDISVQSKLYLCCTTLTDTLCSALCRFHVLTEFDEGKRSCRRRLAGHNERRRKPHPQSHTALSIKASSRLHSDSNTHPSGFTAKDNKRSIFLQHPRRPASPSASLGDDEYASPFASSLKLSPWPRVGQQDDNRLACQLQVSCLCVSSLECLSDKKKHTARVSVHKAFIWSLKIFLSYHYIRLYILTVGSTLRHPQMLKRRF